MRGRWAEGIEPRHFTWVVKDQVAVCERPGGYGADHRKVRRQQEIVWIKRQGLLVLSLCGSTQNLHSYRESGVAYHHVPFGGPADGPIRLTRAMTVIRDHVRAGDRVVVHREEFDERVMGLMASYVLWMGLLAGGPETLTIAERLFRRELGHTAREMVALVDNCAPPEEIPSASKNRTRESDRPG